MGLFHSKKYLISEPEKYGNELKEIIALPRRSVTVSKLREQKNWQFSVELLAFIDVKTNELVRRKTWLHWEAEDNRSRKFRIKEGRRCRLLVLESLPCTTNGVEYEAGRTMFVVKRVKKSASSKELDAVLKEYRKPVSITLPDGTKLELVKNFEHYCGEIDWCGERAEISLNIDMDELEKSTADVLKYLEKLRADQENWDKKAREYAAAELTGCANDWQEQSGEEKPPITEADFARRIGSPFISLSHTGDIEFWFDDDGMFWGHVVVAYGDFENGFTESTFMG